MRTWAIVVAAGGGARFGAAKQFATLGDASVLDRAVGVAVDATRSDSVRAGLALVPDDAEIVLVHDAARPLASRALYALVAQQVADGADGAVPALPVTDTVKRVRDDRVVETVPREGLVGVQTPQAFRAAALRAAH